MSALKGLMLEIYTDASYRKIREDDRAGVKHVAGKNQRIMLVAVDGKPLPRAAQVFTASDDCPPFNLVLREKGMAPMLVPLNPPSGGVGPMMGGAYAATSDSRFSRLLPFYGAVAVHDRYESARNYAANAD